MTLNALVDPFCHNQKKCVNERVKVAVCGSKLTASNTQNKFNNRTHVICRPTDNTNTPVEGERQNIIRNASVLHCAPQSYEHFSVNCSSTRIKVGLLFYRDSSSFFAA